eukprot:g169.t1
MGQVFTKFLARWPKTSLATSLLVAFLYYVRNYCSKYWLLWKVTGLVCRLRRIAPKKFAVETKAPDYDNDPASWAAYPGRKSLAELVPETETYVPESERLCDAFFVHPTGYYGRRWNARAKEGPAASEQTRNWMLSTQASVLNSTCRIYAPYYRQGNIDSFAVDGVAGRKALGLAYEDVRSAFVHFLSKIDSDGPIVLASHSQGGFHLNRLLLEVIENDEKLRERIVAAYIIGSCLPQSLFSNGDCRRKRNVYKFFKISETPTDCHCVVGWDIGSEWYSSFLPPFHHAFEEWPGHFASEPGDQFGKTINTDPLTFCPAAKTYASGPSSVKYSVEKDEWLGLAAAETTLERPYGLFEVISNRPLNFETTRVRRTFPTETSKFYTRGTDNGTIAVPSLPTSKLGLMQNICLFGWYHPIDYELFYFNIRRNVRKRVGAFLSARPLARAPPFSCIILTSPSEADNRVYVECRDVSATVAANTMTCFGGKREFKETPMDCIVRECKEELGGWEPVRSELNVACNFFVDEFFIATFFVGNGPTVQEEAGLAFEKGRKGRWINTNEASISKWHQCAIRAWERGEENARFTTTTAAERAELENLVKERRTFHAVRSQI